MAKLTPMMAQYKKIKAEYEDCILMFRLGDFYEMFFEDAVDASKILQITLTARNKKGDGPAVPMCGIPYHAVDGYLAKLTRAGKKVALCDQITEPNGKGIVEREVVRIVTPGTTFDESILEQKANNFVACVMMDQKGYALAYSDVTTGEFIVSDFENLKDLKAEIIRVAPAECVMPEEKMDLLSKDPSLKEKTFFFPFPQVKQPENKIMEEFEIKNLQVFDLEGRSVAIMAAATLMEYLRETQKTNLNHIKKIQYQYLNDFMPLDESCVRNLELFHSNFSGQKGASLISVIDKTVSAMGGRMIRQWLMHPLVDKEKINHRLDKVDVFVKDLALMEKLRGVLANIYDVERLLSRITLGSGNARDLVALKQSLLAVPLVKNLVKEQLPTFEDQLHELDELVALIEKAILEDAPAITSIGGMIKSGFNQELDQLHGLMKEGKNFISNLQKREIERTGITSLKVKFNKVFGYYIEVSKANANLVPDDYIRKQTLVNAERFITPELKDYEEKVLSAEDRVKELEYKLFHEVRMAVVKEIIAIQITAKALAELDVLSSLAFLAVKNRYTKPEITDENILEIKNGRHPVVEKMDYLDDFVPNDCSFDVEKRFLLITGPNMGGKSTFLRQVALTILMAQIGSFVPAEKAKLGLTDRIFTRVGASDNLARGESTFMVEMTEAAYILNNATEKSLIILDEVGRGTSTYDGVSIAWAMSEFLHDQVKARTIFATHYHELIDLADNMERAVNLSVLVKENEQQGVVFLYRVVEGGVDKSYGIEVAKLAGLPMEVVSRARGVLSELETRHIKKSKVSPNQISIFNDDRKQQVISEKNQQTLEKIREMDINNLTPIEALQKLDELKRIL